MLLHYQFLLHLPGLRASRPGIVLDVIGAGAPPSLVKLAANTAGVTLHGFVPDIRPLIDSAALYICPIRDGGGTKLKMLDAFAMAKCVLAHPIACEGIDVTEGRNVFLASTGEQFVAETLRLLDVADVRRQVGAAARILVQDRYTFTAIGKKLADTFRAAAAR